MTVTPMFPLEVAMLPGEELPLRIFEPRYLALVSDCMAMPEPAFGVVLISAGREVGGGDRRCDIGALARIIDCQNLGADRYRLACVLGERIRVLQWLDDAPYPRADLEPWPDEPGEPVEESEVAAVEERIVALFDLIGEASGKPVPSRDIVAAAGLDPENRLYALAARVPMGQADRYSVLSAPTEAARLAALSEAVDTVTAMVEFQISE
ncbi:LON peptidase substrate-binding domain-containing protein [Mycolicibacterium smegmatis]|uniref:LON peptidase substrate-binding domain-containing protein n=1 Tax=Mycolicibacterium smegmatis TaxID=1772 RepID=UPI0005D92296|nr:LON peptidase substrate-binding domain-containing protein [Mycolicibacterium smegmatis]MDF1901780.1 LON peptidase substrate-binding domain-containing protein [Mycolicibacterium smegmatis]MDF1905787.1 LON peptidase substrate-binding domain-containing protein [Mycolicibacterium smegmatis]MDF1920630.1 LON peptidase substrate-binding domain-containing protein [Mycolicibacterium smegmatis]MDF1926652.1 LON peptidase substrate-binding domain-containing protein [Mycolicibacterium smegmatis]UAK53100